MVDKKRFMYLHKILKRPNDHWTLSMLNHLKSKDLGWVKSVNSKLHEYSLEEDYEKIKVKTKTQWRRDVEVRKQQGQS